MGLFKKKKVITEEVGVQGDPQRSYFEEDVLSMKIRLKEALMKMTVNDKSVSSTSRLIGKLEEKIQSLSLHITDSEKNLDLIAKKYDENHDDLCKLKRQYGILQLENQNSSRNVTDLENELACLREDLKSKTEKIVHQESTIATLNEVLIEKDKNEIEESRRKKELETKCNELTLALATRDRDVGKLSQDLQKAKNEMAELAAKTIKLRKCTLEELNSVTKDQILVLQKMKDKSPDRLVNFLEKQECNILSRKEKYELQIQLSTSQLSAYETEKEKTMLEAKILELNQLVSLLKIDGQSLRYGPDQPLLFDSDADDSSCVPVAYKSTHYQNADTNAVGLSKEGASKGVEQDSKIDAASKKNTKAKLQFWKIK